ncbi:sugar ABC transporter permease [Mycoplasma zalophidermidis]|uniref:carbohydrate ABC transporter permease n=1 Tax=Mycoplasma zalophidermidis TaxID=398174 RepID=UPI001C126717|nr:sugar ABC transporter permease [Mycoplasma zalophidermidis]MBU4689999.1 sugar ABC transporter permease [Mycoplasma zalophidermidis]
MFNNYFKRKSLETNNRFLFNFSINKQAKKNNAISESVVDRRTPFIAALILILPALAVLITFSVVPFIINVKSTFTHVENINGVRTSTWVGFGNVVDLFKQLKFAVGIRNSFIYGLLVLPISMIVSLLVSSLIATVIRKKLRGFLQTIFFLPYVTNIVAVSLAFVQIFQPDGQFNQIARWFGFKGNTPWLQATKEGEVAFKALFVMLVNGVWGSLAFNILLFTTAMLSVDKNLYRSASIDGVGGTKQFFTITLPSINKTITFIMTMGIINGIKVFPLALFEMKPEQAFNAGASTIMLFIYYFVQQNNYELAGAASIILFIIGVSYSTIIRSGFRVLTLASINKGESDVWNKIKNSAEISEHKAKTQKRFSYSSSTW